MPENTYLQAYVKCSKDDFKSVVAEFVDVLFKLGFDEEFLFDSFYGLEWYVDEYGNMDAGCNIDTVKTELFGKPLNIRPFLFVWRPEDDAEIDEPWLELSLLFVTDEITLDNLDYTKTRLRDDVKKPLWEAMELLSKHYYEHGVYLASEVTEGLPLALLRGYHGKMLGVDAVIAPDNIAALYKDSMYYYEKKTDTDRTYLINKRFWGSAPW